MDFDAHRCGRCGVNPSLPLTTQTQGNPPFPYLQQWWMWFGISILFADQVLGMLLQYKSMAAAFSVQCSCIKSLLAAAPSAPATDRSSGDAKGRGGGVRIIPLHPTSTDTAGKRVDTGDEAETTPLTGAKPAGTCCRSLVVERAMPATICWSVHSRSKRVCRCNSADEDALVFE